MPSSASRACPLCRPASAEMGAVMRSVLESWVLESCVLEWWGPSVRRALEVGNQLLGAAGAGEHGDQLPAVDTPGVEDRLGVVDQQWDRGVFPLAPNRFAHEAGR